jgi:hypothetical protein
MEDILYHNTAIQEVRHHSIVIVCLTVQVEALYTVSMPASPGDTIFSLGLFPFRFSFLIRMVTPHYINGVSLYMSS